MSDDVRAKENETEPDRDGRPKDTPNRGDPAQHTDPPWRRPQGTQASILPSGRPRYQKVLITTLATAPKGLEAFFDNSANHATAVVTDAEWEAAKHWVQNHAITAAVLCQKIYECLNWADCKPPCAFLSYRAWTPWLGMADLVKAFKPLIRDESYPEALETSGPTAMALSLVYYTRNKENKLYYFAYHREVWKRERRGDWGATIWIRPQCPAAALRWHGPRDALQSYSAAFGQQ